VGEVVVSLQYVKARAGGAGDDLIVLVEDGRDDGAKLAQAGEQFLFEITRLRGEVLHAHVHEMPLPELRRTPSPDTEPRSKTRTLTPAACKAWAQLSPERPAPIIATDPAFFTPAM